MKWLNEDTLKQNASKSISRADFFPLAWLWVYLTDFPFPKGSESPMMIGELRSDLDDVDP